MTEPAIYSMTRYGEAYYGDDLGIIDTPNNYYRGRPIGLWVRGNINKKLIYRVTRSNGYGGAPPGKLFQDRYNYFVPSTIMHPNGDAARLKFKNGMAAWALLSDEEKQTWAAAATKRSGLKAHNLFMRHYLKGWV